MYSKKHMVDTLTNCQVLIPEISKYLRWYEHLIWRYVNSFFSEAVAHPYIYYARKYYNIRDGYTISHEEAGRILRMTQEQFGTELVETAILSNLPLLQTVPVLDYYKLQKSLSDLTIDREIVRAINASRFYMYATRMSHYLDDNPCCYKNIEEIATINSHEYETILLSGIFLKNDSQIKYLVYRTNLPIEYGHILARRVILSRCRTQIDLMMNPNTEDR